MMSFHYPKSFLFLILYAIVLAVYIWSRWRRLRDLSKIGDWRLIKQSIDVDALKRRRTKDSFLLVALLLLIFSSAGPQFGAKLKEVKQRGVEVFIAMDTSRSMLAEDVEPSRLDRAKRALGVLIEKLGGNRVGIIAFAKRAVIQCPLTVDTDAARMFLDILDDKTVPEQGTALGDAIRLGLQSFPKDDKSGKAIVLLTDGEDHDSDPLGAAKEAKSAGVVIFTIGIGTSKGEVIKDRDEQGKTVAFHKHNGEMVLSRLDDALLNQIAMITGGRYYRASSTDSEIDEIADALNGFEKKEFATKLYERLKERYQFFLFVVLVVLLVEFFFGENPRQFRRVLAGLKKVTPVLLILLVPVFAHADYKDHVRKGNRLVKKGDFPGARLEFESARNDMPEAAFLPYNIAATCFLEGNFDEAKKQYEQADAMTLDPDLKSKIHYNLGHLFFAMGQREQAIEKFKECLKLNPKDTDAKYNIEYIKSGKMPKNPPPQKKQGGSDNQKKEDQKKDPDESKGSQSDKNQENQQKKPGELSKEDAERILQMMKDQESEKMKNAQLAKPGLEKPKDKKEGNGEDW